MDLDLTSNPNTERLTKTKIKGRTVHVSETKEKAYVETDQGLVSMMNLSAWSHLMEEAKKEVMDEYQEEKTVEEKQLERDKKAVADKIQQTQRELAKLEGKFR